MNLLLAIVALLKALVSFDLFSCKRKSKEKVWYYLCSCKTTKL